MYCLEQTEIDVKTNSLQFSGTSNFKLSSLYNIQMQIGKCLPINSLLLSLTTDYSPGMV